MAGNGDSVPSSALANLSPNASTLDDVVNSGEPTTIGRVTPEYPSGKPIRTLAGINEDAGNAIQAIRTVNAGDFDTGFTITARNEVALYPTDGKQYRWIGELPKTVTAGSTPSGTGGIYPSGDWVDVGQAALRSELSNGLLDFVPYQISVSKVYTVGAGGDFSSVNDAINKASKLRTVFNANENEVVVEIRLLSGFELSEQIHISKIDLSFIVITSVDAEVSFVRSSIVSQFGDATQWPFSLNRPVFGAKDGAKLPVIGCLFAGDATTPESNQDGINIIGNSQCVVLPGCGIKNNGNIGVLALHNSDFYGNQSVFDNQGDRGIYGVYGCRMAFREGSAQNCGWTAFQCSSASIGDCTAAQLMNSGHYGCQSRNGSLVEAASVNVSNAFNGGFNIFLGGHINAPDCVADGCGTTTDDYGAVVVGGCTANFSSGSFLSSSGNGIRVAGGSNVNADAVDTTGAALVGIVAEQGATINARNAVGTTNIAKNVQTPNGIILDTASQSFYEEGVWTPEFRGSSVAGAHTYQTQDGYVVRNGNTVTVTFSVRLSSFDAAWSGDLWITNLPHPVFKVYSGGVVTLAQDLASPAGYNGSIFLNTVTTNSMRLDWMDDTSARQSFTVGDAGNELFVQGSITYITDRIEQP